MGEGGAGVTVTTGGTWAAGLGEGAPSRPKPAIARHVTVPRITTAPTSKSFPGRVRFHHQRTIAQAQANSP